MVQYTLVRPEACSFGGKWIWPKVEEDRGTSDEATLKMSPVNDEKV